MIPSPVGPAIVKVVQPSALKPIPAYDGAFLTNIVVQIAFAYCKEQIGRVMEVMIEGRLPEEGVYIARTYMNEDERCDDCRVQP